MIDINILKSLMNTWASKNFNKYEIKSLGKRVILRKHISADKLLEIKADIGKNKLEFVICKKIYFLSDKYTLSKIAKTQRNCHIPYTSWVCTDKDVIELLDDMYRDYIKVIVYFVGRLN